MTEITAEPTTEMRDATLVRAQTIEECMIKLSQMHEAYSEKVQTSNGRVDMILFAAKAEAIGDANRELMALLAGKST